MKKFKDEIFVIIDRNCYCDCGECGCNCDDCDCNNCDCEDVYIAVENEQDFHLNKDEVVEVGQYRLVATRKMKRTIVIA